MIRICFRLMLQGLKDMRRNFWSQAMALGAVTLVVFLAGLFLMLLNTLDNELSTSRGEIVIQVYWKQGMDPTSMLAQWEEISHLPGLVSWSTYTPDEALSALSSRIGQSGSLDISFLKGRSPLPGTAVLNFQPREQEKDYDLWLNQTLEYLKAIPGIERVVANPLREELARVWRSISRQVMIPSICLMAGILALVVGNTIRLTLVSRATEIEILQLVGAENWYVRLPLITSGGALGLAGGILGLALVFLVHWQLKDLYLPPLVTELKFIPALQVIMLLGIPASMGVIGSFLAVRNPVHQEPPNLEG